MKTGIELIAEERQRQLEKGWSLEHDQQHGNGELLKAAETYIMPEHYDNGCPTCREKGWPFNTKFKSGESRIDELAKAGALIAAEIDRLIAEETEDKPRISEEFVGVAEPPSKTFPRVNEFICGSSYRR